MSAPAAFGWSIAATASLALHAALGAALYAMPRAEARPERKTEIRVETLQTGIARNAPSAALEASLPARDLAATPAETIATATTAAGTILEPAEATQDLAARQAQQELAPVEATEAVPTSDAADVLTPTTEAPSAIAATETSDGVDPAKMAAAASSPLAPTEVQATPPFVDVAPSPLTGQQAFAIDAERQIPATAQAPALESLQIIEALAPSIEDRRLAAAQSDNEVAALAPANDAPRFEASAEPVASPKPAGTIAPRLPDQAALSIDSSPGRPVISEAPALTSVDPAQVQAPAVIARTAEASASSGTIAPAQAPLARAFQSVGPVVAAPSTAAQIAPSLSTTLAPADTSPQAVGEEVAMLPRPDAPTGQGRQAPRLGLESFLKEQKDSNDCVLALPSGTGMQQVAIAAFANAPESATRLGDEYQRRSGLRVATDTYPVSTHQCGALAFARDLAQYPNFPLRVTLSPATIGSGEELAGVISGLRKDTLYLMVVDDEGKAELVQSYSGLRANTMPFNAPMTLTSGPVSSVQLLVAIASDGPLQTVAARPGLPADEYFSRLTREIIAGQRSIAYGIAGFVVR